MNYAILLQVGVLLIILGVAVVLASVLLGAKTNEKDTRDSRVKFSVFGLIGPVPFGMANDKRLFYFTVAITLILILLFFVLSKKVPFFE